MIRGQDLAAPLQDGSFQRTHCLGQVLCERHFITTSRGGVTYLAPGTYEYDGSGNVVEIGSDHFLYDRLGRLIEGTNVLAGNNHEQTFGYDGFSNLTSITTTENGFPSTRTIAANPGTNRCGLPVKRGQG